MKSWFFRRWLFMGLGLLLLYLLRHERGPLGFVAFGALVFSFVHFYLIILRFNEVLIAFFPSRKEKSDPGAEENIGFVYSLMGAASLLFFALTLGKYSKVIGGVDLLWKSALLGTVFSVFVTMLIRQFAPNWFSLKNSRLNIIGGNLICCASLFCATSVLLNAGFADENVQSRQFVLKEKNIGWNRRHTSQHHTVRVETPYKENEGFTVNENYFDQVQTGDTLVFMVRKGFFNYDYVLNFTK